MQTQRVPVADGVELAADTWSPAGAAVSPAFVLVHGLASNARLWDGVAACLREAGHPAVTVDLRGHGRSSRPDDGYDTPRVADDLAMLIDALGLERPVVAGQSWGGNVVLELAARHPDATRGLVLVDGGWLEPSSTFASWEEALERLAPPRLAGLHLDEVEAWVRSAHADWPESGIRGTLANFEVRADGTIAPWLSFDRHVRVLEGMWAHRPSQRYGQVHVPVLLAPAWHDDGVLRDQKRGGVETALALLPNARVHWFHGDHDIHAQQPDELASVMLEQVAGGFFG